MWPCGYSWKPNSSDALTGAFGVAGPKSPILEIQYI